MDHVPAVPRGRGRGPPGRRPVHPAAGQEAPGKNRTCEQAAAWAEAVGDDFFLTLAGPKALVFTTDPKFEKGGRDIQVFRVTRAEAAAAVRVLADCGLWGQGDVLAEIPAGPVLTVGKGYARGHRGWLLGTGDDVSSLVILQPLVRATKGTGERERERAKWLARGDGRGRD